MAPDSSMARGRGARAAIACDRPIVFWSGKREDRVFSGGGRWLNIRLGEVEITEKRVKRVNQAAIERAADILWQARLGRRRLETLPADCRPGSLAEGYAIQDAMAVSSGRRWWAGRSPPPAKRASAISA